MNQKEIETTASEIYSILFGHWDDKRFKAEKVSEIEDWLTDGEDTGDLTVLQLASMWEEYDEDEPNLMPIKSQMAALLGSSTSERKAAASRENGKLGGRPRKQ